MDDINKFEEVFEVIEQNLLGDHWVVKRYKTRIQAQQYCDMMNDHSVDGSTYYVNNLEDEWKEVANMIMEESNDHVDKEDNLWYKFVNKYNIEF